MTLSTRATITSGAAAVVAGSAFFGTRYLAVAILVGIVLAALGWPTLLRVSRSYVSTAIIMAGGTLALGAVVIGATAPLLRYMIVAIAAVTIAALVAEIFFPSAPGRAVTSVSATAAAGAVAASGAAWVAADRTLGAQNLVVAAAASLAVAAVASVATSKATINTVLALVLGTATGAGTGAVFATITWYGGALAGLVTAATTVLVNELARREPRPPNVWAGIASALTPVLVAGALVYVAGRLLVG